MAERPADKSQPWFPLSGIATDYWSKEDEATATCLCGTVQLAFVSLGPAFAHERHPILPSLIIASESLANPRSWSSRFVRLQLRRLP